MGDLDGFRRHFRHDLLAGFLVFLIALPLCLGIALASGFPPLAGVITAVVGAIVTPTLSNSELTIKGPAAGLIVIVIGCINDFGGDGAVGGFTDLDMAAYRATLAVGVVAAVMQIVLGAMRAGVLGEFFPSAVVQGMLAAIGVIIIVKQAPVALGVSAGGPPLEMLQSMPDYFAAMNPAIATIGFSSAAIIFLWPIAARRNSKATVIPAPLLVVAVAIVLGLVFSLSSEHSYRLAGAAYDLGPQHLVEMPARVFGAFDAITLPDFTALSEPKAWKWVVMLFAIGSLESILSAKAVDAIDPWRRRADYSRDTLAVGAGNLIGSLVGGLPMISEIVRSRANVDNGARTRFANLWHGVFLLVCVSLIPMVLHRIPLAALAAMLVYTGFRLAHPTVLVQAYQLGSRQLIVFTVTLYAVLATDLLMGVLAGVVVKLVLLALEGVPVAALFRPRIEVQALDGGSVRIATHDPAVFSNWLPLRRAIERGAESGGDIFVDLGDSSLVDHNVAEKLDEMRDTLARSGTRLRVRHFIEAETAATAP